MLDKMKQHARHVHLPAGVSLALLARTVGRASPLTAVLVGVFGGSVVDAIAARGARARMVKSADHDAPVVLVDDEEDEE
ncbi:MAG: hypothetical protein ABIG71_00730 [Candidatus Uhrbacteria bacterium]